MNIWTFSSFISFVMQLLLAIIVYQTNKKAEINKIFTLICIVCVYINFCEFMLRQSESFEHVYFWHKTASFFPILTPLFVHFILRFLNYRKLLQNKLFYILIYLPAVLFSFFILFTDMIIAKPIKCDFGYMYFTAPDNPLLFIIYNSWSLLFVLVSLVICIKGYFTTSIKILRTQLKFITIGFGFPIIFILIKIILSVFRIEIPEIFTFGMMWENIFIVYAIRRYGLFELTPEALINEILHIMPDSLFILDKNSIIVEINNAAVKNLGHKREDLMYQPFKSILLPEANHTFHSKLEHIHLNNILQFDTILIHHNTEQLSVSLSISTVRNRQERVCGYIVTCHDITERKKTEERIKFLAYNDPLTSLKNRKALYEYLEKDIIQAERSKTINAIALLFIDLDDFKSINDTLGHEKGDLLLKEIARRIKHSLRQSDIVFRLGGDEFVVLLHNITQEIDAGLVAEKLLNIISRPLVFNDYDYFPSASIGISLFPKDGVNVETLIKHADIAMYEAKREKNKYFFFSKEMTFLSIQRTQMLKDIHSALDTGQFMVHYQPIVNQDTGIVGAEALIRWHHPEKGMIPPMDFIPIAESSRIIKDIDEFVLKCVCREIKKLESKGLTIIFSINFSGLHMCEKNIVQNVESILNEFSVKPNQIIIELTETYIINNENLVKESINQFSRMGIKIALDDFGTGNSAINYMLYFPITYLKIERLFINRIIDDIKYNRLIESIITLAKKLELKIIAEGVEQYQQHTLLKEWGCELMQGFLYSKPIPIEELTALLKRGSIDITDKKR